MNRVQGIERLVGQCAYELWHRMLFARFLAENGLLMHPDGIAVTLEECGELAAEEGIADAWVLATRYAARMLPQIFRPEDPVLQVKLATEHQKGLERLLTDLPVAVFTAGDSLGWVYQFWQANNKERINKAEVKIGAQELPAVTQLFTEAYMVSFLLDNALGAWWTARRLSADDLKTADSEAELRQKAAIPGVPLTYLRFVRLEDQSWTPAAGSFAAWPDSLADLKVLDPCCGSGHFLVAALLMLVPMRMALEGLSAQAAVDAVLAQNLHGLELDQRCVELAAFALALAAWTYPGAGGYRGLPELHLACSGLSVSVAKEEWKLLGAGTRNLGLVMESLHSVFQDAPVLGSLLNPARTAAAGLVKWEELAGALAQALQQEPTVEQQEVAVVAQGLAKAAMVMVEKYDWVITNVPYLARGKQGETLRQFCEDQYKEAKNDLATVFLERCLELCRVGGTVSVVVPQNWLFLTSYKSFREKLLKRDTWRLIARLGSGAFETISGEVVKAVLLTLSRGTGTTTTGSLFASAENGNQIRGLDVSDPRSAAAKAEGLIGGEVKSVSQAKQLENPDGIVSLEELGRQKLLSEFADYVHGMAPGDTSSFTRKFWELTEEWTNWEYMVSTPEYNNFFSGKTLKILHPDIIASSECKGFRYDGRKAWGKKGIVVGKMRELPASYYLGEILDDNIHAIIPNHENYLLPIRAYIEFGDFSDQIRLFNQKLAVTSSSVVKVPFDLDYWQKVADEKYPNGLPHPYTNDPTQWIFHGHPCGSVIWDEDLKWTAHGTLRTDETVLHIAVARLLGYRWPAERDPDMELAAEQREWVKRCEALLSHADNDGIVCIPPIRGEQPAADRLRSLLVQAYGSAWTPTHLQTLLTQAGSKTLEDWLRNSFFDQHCKLFHHRPFIWQIWDGRKDGFSVLVNYHKLDRKGLEKLIYTYLGDWIIRQKDGVERGESGSDAKLLAAQQLQKKLELILEGEDPYDIFVRWKPLEQQPIGWDPDLNDGVRLNIRPFMTADILRKKPNIKWNKDRGKNPPGSPWGEERINDRHLSLDEKRTARENAATNS